MRVKHVVLVSERISKTSHAVLFLFYSVIKLFWEPGLKGLFYVLGRSLLLEWNLTQSQKWSYSLLYSMISFSDIVLLNVTIFCSIVINVKIFKIKIQPNTSYIGPYNGLSAVSERLCTHWTFFLKSIHLAVSQTSMDVTIQNAEISTEGCNIWVA